MNDERSFNRLRRLYDLLPTRKQWEGWSLPSKLTAIGAYVGVAALLLALIAPLVGLTVRLLEEELYVEVGPFEDRIPVELGRGYGNHSPPPVTFAFPVKLVNASSRNIAVVDYEVRQLNCDYIDAFDDTEAVRGLFEDPAGTKPREVPISLPAGSGTTIYARFGITSWFHPENADPDTLTVRQLRLLAARHDSVDLVGNPVEVATGVRGWTTIDVLPEDTVFQPVFEITFVTSRRSKVRTMVAPYPELIDRIRLNTCGAKPLTRESPLMIDQIEEAL